MLEEPKLLVSEVTQNPIRSRLSTFIYGPTLLLIILIMIGAIFSGLVLIIYDTEASILPNWFNHLIRYFIVPVGSFYNVYEAESSKHLNIFFVMMVGIFMAKFVQRCSVKNAKFESYMVRMLILLMGIQIYINSTISIEHIQDQIKFADKVVKYLEIIIVRNCNIAAVIIAAAIGAASNE